MAPVGALSQAWVSAEAFSPLGWQMRGLWRFGGLWVALSEGSVHMDQAPWRLKRRPTSMSDLGQGWSVRRLSRFTGTLGPPISQQLAASGAKSGGGSVATRPIDPMQFFSFGPSTSLEAIADFRARPEFGEAVGRMRLLLESIETFTLDGVARFERPSSG
jgi:hypothetical protein